MSNFLVVVDPDMSRRAGLIRDVGSMIAPVSGLKTDTHSVGDFAAICAVGPRAPVNWVAGPIAAGILFGEAISTCGPERLSVEELIALRLDPKGNAQSPLDGYYAAIVYRPGASVLAEADLLGLFPLYYWASNDVLLVGSSPELFRYHPGFRMKLSLAGLVGVLLTNGLVDGQTLLSGVRRLAAGHRLEWAPGASPHETPQFQIPVSARYSDLSFEAQVHLLGATLEDAVARHAPSGRRYGLLLSGGLDSRMLGGFLKEKNADVDTLTLGVAGDIEMQIATRVARTLGYGQRKG